jgi:hypothetical protein
MELKVMVAGKNRSAVASALIDNGATGNLISDRFVKTHCIKTYEIPWKIELLNADDSKSLITSRVCVNMEISNGPIIHRESITLYVGNIGSHEIILGTPWLIKHNPSINWTKYLLQLDRCPEECKTTQPLHVVAKSRSQLQKVRNRATALKREGEIRWAEDDDQNTDDHRINAVLLARAIFHEKEYDNLEEEVDKQQDPLSWSKVRWDHFHKTLRSRSAKVGLQPKSSNTAQQLAQQASKEKPKKTKEELVPQRYHEYMKVFDEQEANRFPSSKIWDHAINLKDDYKPKDCKIYPLSPVERHSLDKWISEQLDKGYI